MRCPVCLTPASRIDVGTSTIEVSDTDGSHAHHARDLPRRDLDPEDLGITPDRDVNGVAYLRGAA